MTNSIYRNILMADDDQEDCMLANEAFKESGVNAEFFCVEDGIALMDYLSKNALLEPKRLPDLILLDLNMPRKDGREALLEIKSRPALLHLPIVILTTSENQRDIAFAMKAGADSIITKPASFGGWVDIMKSLGERWFS